jgi:hypothetical protein
MMMTIMIIIIMILTMTIMMVISMHCPLSTKDHTKHHIGMMKSSEVLYIMTHINKSYYHSVYAIVVVYIKCK